MATMFEIQSHERTDNHAEYDVIVDGELFKTWVTHCPYKVQEWIRGTENRNKRRLHRLIVGLDIECHPSSISGVAILQLFVGRHCMIYHLQKTDKISDDLKSFLKNPNYTFVGVGIEEDKQKLLRDYSLEVTKSMDVREMAAYELADPSLHCAGLKKLFKVITGKDVDYGELMKARSDWNNSCLSNSQIIYACLDVYLSFEIGRKLQVWYD